MVINKVRLEINISKYCISSFNMEYLNSALCSSFAELATWPGFPRYCSVLRFSHQARNSAFGGNMQAVSTGTHILKLQGFVGEITITLKCDNNKFLLVKYQ